MSRLSLSEVFSVVEKEQTDSGKVNILRHHDTPVLRQIVKYALDLNIKWLLPPGKPPYSPSQEIGCEGRLISEARRLYLFIEGGNPSLTKIRMETLFVQLLEAVHPKDAELLLLMKDRKLPGNVNLEIVNEAFPGLIGGHINTEDPPEPEEKIEIEVEPQGVIEVSEKNDRSQRLKDYWADPVKSEATKKKMREAWARRKASGETIPDRWADPVKSEATKKKMREAWVRRKAAKAASGETIPSSGKKSSEHPLV
jgi:hypothetical protein